MAPENKEKTMTKHNSAVVNPIVSRVAGYALILGAVLVMAGSPRAQSAQDKTPGFQGTVNNYAVRMNPGDDCQKRNDGCSQHFNFHFQANTDGTINAPFEITNDSLNGFCGRVRIVARDRAGNPPGNVLLDVRSGTYCIPGKGRDTGYHERVQHIEWSFTASPQVGINGHDLYMVVENYQDRGIDWGSVVASEGPRIIETVGTAIKIAAVVLPK
jgi:hypothetical protein